jgi:hypothetical protein
MAVRSYDPQAVILASMREMVQRLDAGALAPAEAADQADWFHAIERLAVAGRTVAVQRAVEGELWLQSGERSAADWLVKRTGTTIAEARSVIDTGQALLKAPLTDEKFRAGRLSLKQAEAVAGAAAVNGGEESRLLELARQGSLRKLRDECARVRAAASDPVERRERLRRERVNFSV